MHLDEALTLLLYALGAFAVPLAAGRVGLPAAVGEIAYGVLLGPGVLGLIQPGRFSTVLAEIGFCFLMFLAGLELDFSRIERVGARGVALAAAVAALFFCVALAGTLALHQPLFMMLVFGATSVGILLVTLAELRMTKGHAGQTMILVGSIGEFITIILLTAMGFIYQYGVGLLLAWELSKLALIFGVAYALLILLRTLIWWWPERFSRMVAHHDPSEVGVRAGIALMLVFVVLAVLLHVEAILGAFIAGALFSFVFRAKGLLETKLSSIGFGFFVPIFFIWVGTEFDLAAVLDLGVLAAVGGYLVAALLAKVLPALLLVLGGLSLREALGAGLLLGAPLTLLVAISRIGLRVKVIDAQTASAVVLLAVVTAVVLPWGFRWMMTRGRA